MVSATKSRSPAARAPVATVVVALGLVVLAMSIAVTVTIGPAELSVSDVYAVIFDRIGVADSSVSAIREGIVWELRLPRTLLARCAAQVSRCAV